jgi:hypothetical protein
MTDSFMPAVLARLYLAINEGDFPSRRRLIALSTLFFLS